MNYQLKTPFINDAEASFTTWSTTDLIRLLETGKLLERTKKLILVILNERYVNYTAEA